MLNKLDRFENCDYTLLIGRVCLALVYFFGGLNWLLKFSPPAGMLDRNGWPAAALAAWIALVLKLGGSTLVILGYQTRLGAAALVVFTLITAFGFHFPEALWPADTTFFKEICMIGGLLVLMTTGPGKFSLDGRKAG